MDTLTHALSGALIARATAPRGAPRGALPLSRRIAVGALAAAFPDIDFVTAYLTPLSYLHNHRGVTHSLVMLPLWTALIALVFAAVWRFRLPWRAYVGIAALGIAAHIAGDLITSFGTMIFAPLSDARFALSTTFIIDLWFSGIIVAGLAASTVWRRRRAPAVLGLLALCGYVGFQYLMREQAVDFGERHARATDAPDARVTAIPRPVSPFNWTVVVDHGGRYEYANVNLVRRSVPPPPDAASGFIERLDATYRPLGRAVWNEASIYGVPAEAALAREAYEQPGFRFFRWFATYPALLGVVRGNPQTCVWFEDLKFVTPGRRPTPFQYGMCREAEGRWEAYQLRGPERRRVY